MRRMSLPLGVAMLLLGAGMALEGAPPAAGKGPQEILKAGFKRPAVRATLAQALSDLGKLADVPIAVDWQGLLETGVKPEATLSLPATEATLEKLLEQTLVATATQGHPLAWRMVEGRVCVTTQARVLRHDQIVLTGGTATARPAQAAGPATRPATPETARGGNFEFDKAPLSQVMEVLRQSSGVNFHVNYTALATSGVDKDTPITLSVRDITAAKALDLVTEQLSGGKSKYDSIYWVVDDGVVRVTTGTALDATLQTRVHDVGDLLMTVPTFQAPRMSLDLGSVGTGNGAGTTNNQLFNTNNQQQNTLTNNTPPREDMQAKLIGIVQKSIGDDMWQPQGKGNISFLRNMMIITQTRLGFLLLEKSSVLH